MNIIERDVGSIPVSIGTALAFEGMLGIYPDPEKQPKQPVPLSTIREVWVNLRTMARNLYSAVPSAESISIDLSGAVEVLLQEVQTLPIALAQHGFKGKVRFYMASKDAIKWQFPHAMYKDKKEKKSPKQMGYDVYERFVSIELFQRLQQEGLDPLAIDGKPKERVDGTVALLTHMPTDLFWKPSFTRLLLLESHTGKLKAWNHWYTKLHGITADVLMPFTEYTIQVFGDGVMFEPQPLKIKKALKALAIDKKWTAVTSVDKVHYDIMGSRNDELIQNYKMLRR